MQATVSHGDFARAVKIASKTVNRRTHVAALGGIRLEVRGPWLEVRSTDLEMTSSTSLDLAPGPRADGVALVPAAQLAAAVKGKAAKDATVILELDQENGTLTVRTVPRWPGSSSSTLTSTPRSSSASARWSPRTSTPCGHG